jgi:beta-glucosidase
MTPRPTSTRPAICPEFPAWRVTFTITNHGAAGEEVPQIYLGAPLTEPAGVQFLARALAAFDRVSVGADRSARVTIDVPVRELSYWSTATNR